MPSPRLRAVRAFGWAGTARTLLWRPIPASMDSRRRWSAVGPMASSALRRGDVDRAMWLMGRAAPVRLGCRVCQAGRAPAKM